MKSYRPWLLATLISANISAAPSDETHYFTVLHTNDSHGHFWQNERGEYGFPAQKTVIDSIRQEVESQGNALILLHAGDYNTGVPESDLLNAIPDIEGLNAMGYEAVALGNHEFDFPLNQLLEQQKQAKFALVSANVLSKETEKPLVNPYIVLQKGALKVAVMGLTTEDTAKLSNPEVTAEVVFKPAIKTAQETLKIINEHDKPDIRIALTHMAITTTHSMDKMPLVMSALLARSKKGIWILLLVGIRITLFALMKMAL
nr:metallophosphoesterase [Rappaport israeli]